MTYSKEQYDDDLEKLYQAVWSSPVDVANKALILREIARDRLDNFRSYLPTTKPAPSTFNVYSPKDEQSVYNVNKLLTQVASLTKLAEQLGVTKK